MDSQQKKAAQFVADNQTKLEIIIRAYMFSRRDNAEALKKITPEPNGLVATQQAKDGLVNQALLDAEQAEKLLDQLEEVFED
jgi:hypothetical protein